jgi:hypothetical protein
VISRVADTRHTCRINLYRKYLQGFFYERFRCVGTDGPDWTGDHGREGCQLIVFIRGLCLHDRLQTFPPVHLWTHPSAYIAVDAALINVQVARSVGSLRSLE